MKAWQTLRKLVYQSTCTSSLYG